MSSPLDFGLSVRAASLALTQPVKTGDELRDVAAVRAYGVGHCLA